MCLLNQCKISYKFSALLTISYSTQIHESVVRSPDPAKYGIKIFSINDRKFQETLHFGWGHIGPYFYKKLVIVSSLHIVTTDKLMNRGELDNLLMLSYHSKPVLRDNHNDDIFSNLKIFLNVI